jgi:formylglycine-generating enzyme required for sulfatase activity
MRNVPFVLAMALGAATLLAQSNGHQFVVIKPSEFVMGSPPGQPGRTPDEVQRRVRIPRSFAIATTETTVAQFRRFLEANPEAKARHAYPKNPEEMAKVMQRFSPDDQSPQIAVLKPNPLGLFDIYGNVWEWTHDRRQDFTASDVVTEDREDAVLTVDDQQARTRRGGSFAYGAYTARSAHRGDITYFPNQRRDNVGFRVARTVR